MKETWRWFGPDDPVSLNSAKQAGAKAIVSALYHIPNGAVWPVDEIRKYNDFIRKYELDWEIVESLPVHETIKIGLKDKDQYIDQYIQSLKNLAQENIRHVIYNFMALTDWTRTDLRYQDIDGAITIKLDMVDLAMFDILILKRKDAEKSYEPATVSNAIKRFSTISQDSVKRISDVILMGLPGTVDNLTMSAFKEKLKIYHDLGKNGLRENLKYFLDKVIPVAIELGVTLSVHADDPPFPIFGLPRVISTSDDLSYISNSHQSKANAICFCSGTLGASDKNNIYEMLQQHMSKISFFHLRNVQRLPDGSFYESKLLEGSIDMIELAKLITAEQKHRGKVNEIPYRPDHGQVILSDKNEQTYPGYPAIGRLKSLAELRGIFHTLESFL